MNDLEMLQKEIAQLRQDNKAITARLENMGKYYSKILVEHGNKIGVFEQGLTSEGPNHYYDRIPRGDGK